MGVIAQESWAECVIVQKRMLAKVLIGPRDLRLRQSTKLVGRLLAPHHV